MSIRSILARHNGDSFGTSSLQVDLQTDLGLFRAVLPRGASTGTVEGDDEFNKENPRDCVSQEIGIINKIIAPELLKSGLEVIRQTDIDEFIVNLFGDIIGSKTVRNAILGISLAVAMAGAVEKGIPLRDHIAHLADNKETLFPIPGFRVISGESHAGNKLVMEEFVILPAGVPSLTYAIGMDGEIYDQLKKLIKEKFRVDAMTIGDISTMFVIVNNKECSDHIKTALNKAGKIDIAMDASASQFSEEGQCVSSFSHSEKSFLYQQFSKEFPMVFFEHCFNLDVWAAHISSTTIARIEILGDHFIENNPKAIETEISSNSLKYKADAVLQSYMDIRSEIDRLFLNKDANFQLESEYTTLHAAAKHGYAQLVEVLLELNANVNSSAAQNFTPLHLSAAAGHTEICMMLLKKGADVNAKNEDGETPLHLSAENGHAEICRMLLNKGADVNANNEFQQTPLHLSAQGGQVEICMILLNKGADVNAKNDFGETPLHRSADKGHAEVCSVLLNKGADVNAESEDGETPLHLAAENGGAETCRVLLNNGADVNAKTEYGRTPLHVSAIEDQAEICMMLLDNGADVNAKNESGQTPLCLAAKFGDENTVTTILKFDPDIHTTDSDGQTPLHIASGLGHRDVVRILLEYGCDINNMGTCNKTPLDSAMSRLAYAENIDIVAEIVGHIGKLITANSYVSEENLEAFLSWHEYLSEDL